MKKGLLILTAVLWLSSCLGTDIEGVDVLEEYQDDFYTIAYPQGWDVFTREDRLKDAPADTLIVFRSPTVIDGIYPNISIVKDEISEDLPADEYAKINLEKIPLIVKNFQTVGREEVEIDGHKTIMINFLGRLEDADRDLQRYQIFFARKNIGITITAVCSPDSVDTLKSSLQNSLKSFRFK